MDRFLNFPQAYKQQTIIRTDAGFGSDRNVNYALDEEWQFTGKGFSAQRASNLAAKVAREDWLDLEHQRWVAVAPVHPSYLRPVQYLLLRWTTQQGLVKYAAVICSIPEWSPREVIAHYDDRGQCETEIEADKGGLKMCQRRKLRMNAQEALILLTDVAHNLVAWSKAWMFPEGPLSQFGTTRLIEDVFPINGRLIFAGEELIEVQMNEDHPYAEATRAGLQRLLEHFELL